MPGRHHAEARRPDARDALERRHDAPDRPEQPDERRDARRRRQQRQPPLELGDLHRRRPQQRPVDRGEALQGWTCRGVAPGLLGSWAGLLAAACSAPRSRPGRSRRAGSASKVRQTACTSENFELRRKMSRNVAVCVWTRCRYHSLCRMMPQDTTEKTSRISRTNLAAGRTGGPGRGPRRRQWHWHPREASLRTAPMPADGSRRIRRPSRVGTRRIPARVPCTA